MSLTEASICWSPGPIGLLLASLASIALLLRTPGDWFDWIWPAAFAAGAVANALTWWRARAH